jgi:hypothetical protein
MVSVNLQVHTLKEVLRGILKSMDREVLPVGNDTADLPVSRQSSDAGPSNAPPPIGPNSEAKVGKWKGTRNSTVICENR